jgi:hypothetical protein
MSQLKDLIKDFEALKSEDLDTRAILVLDMIEKTITYPSLETFSKKDILKTGECVQKLVRDLRKNKQYLFAVRISKIWKNREHLCQLAKNWHEIRDDFMDEIEYHEEVKWLRDEQVRLTQKKVKHN